MKKRLGPSLLPFPSPVWLIGTYDELDRPNVMPLSWGGICCSDPPCLAISVKKERYTYDNLIKQGAFTVNMVSIDQVGQADYMGMHSGREEDKCLAVGWQLVSGVLVHAPVIAQALIAFECHVRQRLELGSHWQFIGEILEVQAEEAILDEQNSVLMSRVSPLLSSAVDRKYYGLGAIIGSTYTQGSKWKKS